MTRIPLPVWISAAVVAGYFRLQPEFGSRVALLVCVGSWLLVAVYVVLHRRFGPPRWDAAASEFNDRWAAPVSAVFCAVLGPVILLVSVAMIASGVWVGLIPAALALLASYVGLSYPRRARKYARTRRFD